MTSGANGGGAARRRSSAYYRRRKSLLAEEIRRERRILIGCTLLSGIGALLVVMSMLTKHWYVLTYPRGLRCNWCGSMAPSSAAASSASAFGVDDHELQAPPPSLEKEAAAPTLNHSSFGLWAVCHTLSGGEPRRKSMLRRYSDSSLFCQTIPLWPTETELREPYYQWLDKRFLDYVRSSVGMAVVTAILIFIGHMFAVYSLKVRRYMLKRVTAVLHLFSAACIFAQIEVVIHRIKQLDTADRWPPEGTVANYSYSFVMACMALSFFLVAAITFLVLSRKYKRDSLTQGVSSQHEYEESEQAAADEPLALGRML